VDRNVEIPAGDFVLETPPDAKATPYELPVPRPFGTAEMPMPAGVAAPKLQKKRDLNYDENSRKAGVEGTVILYLIVDTGGIPSDIGVFRSLNAGLYDESVRTVKQWRFQPAMKDGKPLPVPQLVELNFRLAH
jgi:protein TonB